jgi:5-methylcytosine-specific restriction endonuclease McrA
MLLLFTSKAELIEKESGKYIRSVSQSFDFPSVIRLLEYHRISYKQVELSRKNIFRRDGRRCQYCGTTNGKITIDHIIPKSRGGKESWENLTTACFSCNNVKGNRTPSEAKMPLLSRPQEPNYVIYLNQKIGNPKVEWKQFLYC